MSRRPPVAFFAVSVAAPAVLVAAFFAPVEDLDCAATGSARSAQARQATHKRAKRKLFMSSVYTRKQRNVEALSGSRLRAAPLTAPVCGQTGAFQMTGPAPRYGTGALEA